MYRLPPLGALRAFEAAARHLSFKAAASELGVTPTAISHQVRTLEDWLGHRLFDRHTRRVALTQDGRTLATPLREGFESFADVISRIRSSKSRPTVTLTATTAFTAHWLIPRLDRFRTQNGQIDLSLLASDDPVDLQGGAADLAIRYGYPPYPGLETQQLIRDRFVPVASPAIARALHEDVAGARLIHFAWRRPQEDPPDWSSWFTAAGMGHRPVTADGDLRFNEESHAIEAAIAGHGVALLSATLVADALARGVLVRLSGPALDGPGFSLAWSSRRPLSDAAEAVRTWLLEAVREATRIDRE